MLLQDLTHIISNTPVESIQEEFLDLDGTYDLSYLKYLLETKKVKMPWFNQELTSAGLPFMYTPRLKVRNEVSKEEFFEEYEFGKFGNVRQWIQHFSWKHKKVLTRESLFGYINEKYAPKKVS